MICWGSEVYSLALGEGRRAPGSACVAVKRSDELGAGVFDWKFGAGRGLGLDIAFFSVRFLEASALEVSASVFEELDTLLSCWRRWRGLS